MEFTFLGELFFSQFCWWHWVASITQSTDSLLLVNSVYEKCQLIGLLALVDLQKILKTGHSCRIWLVLILIICTLCLGKLLSSSCVKSTGLYHTQFEFFLDRHLISSSTWILSRVCIIYLVLLVLLLLFLQQVYHLLILLRSIILRISAITDSSECLSKWSQSILLRQFILLRLTDILHWKTATKISYSERLQFYSWVLARIVIFPFSLLEYVLVTVFDILDCSFGILSCKKWLTLQIWTL